MFSSLSVLQVRDSRAALIEGSPEFPMIEGRGNCLIAYSWDGSYGIWAIVSAAKGAEYFS